MFFDPIYLMLIGAMMLLSFIASTFVKSRFKAAQQVQIGSGMSGFEVAQAILNQSGIDDVRILESDGFLTDHYNPMEKKLVLSTDVYHGRNAAAAGVAAHEVGHAIQHAHNYVPMWFRSVIVPPANIGSQLGPWLIILGIILGTGSAFGYISAWAGVILFGISTLFTLITVPVEFDASARAKEKLQALGYIRGSQENAAVSGVLTAAGLTYVAAAISSIAMLLYWAARAGLFGGSDD
jgi:Zn-dependent membrane protease YugP